VKRQLELDKDNNKMSFPNPTPNNFSARVRSDNILFGSSEDVMPTLYGAKLDGVSDDTAAFVAALKAAEATGRYVRLDQGQVCRIQGVIYDGEAVRIRGDGELLLAGVLNVSATKIFHMLGIKRSTTGADRGILQSSGSTVDDVWVENVECTGGFGFHFRGAVRRGRFLYSNFHDLNGASSSVQGILIGTSGNANSLPDAERTWNVDVIGNTFENINSNSSDETHAVYIHGNAVRILNNFCKNISHPPKNACEAIYTKASYVDIGYNTIIDCDPSEDGYITAKGGKSVHIHHNHLAYLKDEVTAVVGIMSSAADTKVHHNTLTNTLIRPVGENSQISHNSVEITTNGFIRDVMLVEHNRGRTTVDNNKFTLFSKNVNSNTLKAMTVRGATADTPLKDFIFRNNQCRVIYEGLTTGAGTVASFMELRADSASVEALIEGNEFTVEAPNLITVRNLVGVYTQSTNPVKIRASKNTFNNVAPISIRRNVWIGGTGARDIKFSDELNTVHEINENFVCVNLWDAVIMNTNATASRLISLTPPIKGRRLKVVASNLSYGMTIRPGTSGSDGTKWHDGTEAVKTLTAGSSVTFECFHDGYRTVVSSVGSFS
jgi:hypothetical protein